MTELDDWEMEPEVSARADSERSVDAIVGEPLAMVNERVSSARRRERFFDLRFNGGEVEFIEKLKVLRVVGS